MNTENRRKEYTSNRYTYIIKTSYIALCDSVTLSLTAARPNQRGKSEVLIVMEELGLIHLVHLLASFLHVFGQSGWPAAEYTEFTHLQTITQVTKKADVLADVSNKHEAGEDG